MQQGGIGILAFWIRHVGRDTLVQIITQDVNVLDALIVSFPRLGILQHDVRVLDNALETITKFVK